jgi:integrase
MRRSEQVRARWDHYSFEENWVLIPDENTRTRTGRVIPLNPIVKAMLVKRRKEQLASARMKGTPFVFPSRWRADKPISESGIGRFWRDALESAGLKGFGYEPHDLRATGEHETAKDARFTDTQREKFAGASMSVQKRIYLQGYMADDLRGLETAIVLDGLESLVMNRLKELPQAVKPGKTRAMTKQKKAVDNV